MRNIAQSLSFDIRFVLFDSDSAFVGHVFLDFVCNGGTPIGLDVDVRFSQLSSISCYME